MFENQSVLNQIVNVIEMQLIDFQSSHVWTQKKHWFSTILNKITENKILTTGSEIPESFDCLKKLAKSFYKYF